MRKPISRTRRTEEIVYVFEMVKMSLDVFSREANLLFLCSLAGKLHNRSTYSIRLSLCLVGILSGFYAVRSRCALA